MTEPTTTEARERIKLQVLDFFHFQMHDLPAVERTYWAMVKKWREIVGRTSSEEEKRVECLAILQAHIESLAFARVAQPNAEVRFLADMMVLKQQLKPMGAAFDPLGRLAVRPAHDLVSRWVSGTPKGRDPATLGI